MQGVSAANIGRRLGKSRNAVIGKASRMRLPMNRGLAPATNQRPGQSKFRSDVLALYEGTCAVTGTSILPVVEAAHIIPYAKSEDNSASNGICLRADLHALFDAGLMTITPALTVRMSPTLRDWEYQRFSDQTLALLDLAKRHVGFGNLAWHGANVFGTRNEVNAS